MLRSRCLVGLGLVAALQMSMPAAGGAEPSDVPIVYVARYASSGSGNGVPVRGVAHRAWGQLVLKKGGSTKVLVDGTQGGPHAGNVKDVMDPDVSWDGARIVFSGFSAAERAWRIYEVHVDGTGLRQITSSDRLDDLSRHGDVAKRLEGYDDLDPCYLPDGRICFVSTRYPEIAPDGRERSTNLYLVGADGADVHRLTTERFGADTPAVDPTTGKIVYSRWWRSAQSVEPLTGKPPPPPPAGAGYYKPVDRPNTAPTTESGEPDVLAVIGASPLSSSSLSSFAGLNCWTLASINPDGSDLQMVSGFHLDREAGQAYRPAFSNAGEIAALFIAEPPLLGEPGRKGLRVVSRGMGTPQLLRGPQSFARGVLPIEKATEFVASAAWISTDEMVVSEHSRFIDDGFGLVVLDRVSGTSRKLVDADNVDELDATPVVVRGLPPVPPDAGPYRLTDIVPSTVDEAIQAGGTFTFLCENVHTNAALDVPMAGAPPVGTPLLIEFYTSPQRSGGDTVHDAPILVRRVEVPPSGRIETELPLGVPLFEVLRTKSGAVPAGRDGQIFHVGGFNFGSRPGTARCVGCHAGHSMIQPPVEPAWTNIASSAVVTAPGFLTTREIGGPTPFSDQRFVDRSTKARATHWDRTAAQTAKPTVALRFPAPIEARQVVLHGKTDRVTDALGDDVIWGIRAVFRLDGESRFETVIAGELPESGAHLRLDSPVTFDSLELVVTGIVLTSASTVRPYGGSQLPGIAEIEILGRVSEAHAASSSVAGIRGDTNCDRNVDLSDAISLLGSLFDGKGEICCAPMGDANGDRVLDLSDSIHLLTFLYHAGAPPAAPFPACGAAPLNEQFCREETCE